MPVLQSRYLSFKDFKKCSLPRRCTNWFSAQINAADRTSCRHTSALLSFRYCLEKCAPHVGETALRGPEAPGWFLTSSWLLDCEACKILICFSTFLEDLGYFNKNWQNYWPAKWSFGTHLIKKWLLRWNWHLFVTIFCIALSMVVQSRGQWKGSYCPIQIKILGCSVRSGVFWESAFYGSLCHFLTTWVSHHTSQFRPCWFCQTKRFVSPLTSAATVSFHHKIFSHMRAVLHMFVSQNPSSPPRLFSSFLVCHVSQICKRLQKVQMDSHHSSSSSFQTASFLAAAHESSHKNVNLVFLVFSPVIAVFTNHQGSFFFVVCFTSKSVSSQLRP